MRGFKFLRGYLIVLEVIGWVVMLGGVLLGILVGVSLEGHLAATPYPRDPLWVKAVVPRAAGGLIAMIGLFLGGGQIAWAQVGRVFVAQYDCQVETLELVRRWASRPEDEGPEAYRIT